MQGKIIKSLAGFYYVESNGQVYQTRARGNFRKKGIVPMLAMRLTFRRKNILRVIFWPFMSEKTV